MRKISSAERFKRGCTYCAYSELIEYYDQKLRGCPFEECPYRELDEFDTYEDYLKAKFGSCQVDDLISRTLDEAIAECKEDLYKNLRHKGEKQC